MKVFWCQIECLVSFSICYKTFSARSRRANWSKFDIYLTIDVGENRWWQQSQMAYLVKFPYTAVHVPYEFFEAVEVQRRTIRSLFSWHFSLLFSLSNLLSISDAFEYTKLFILARVGLGWLNCYALITLIAHSRDPGTGSKISKPLKFFLLFLFTAT